MNSERTRTGCRRLMAMALLLAPFSCWATGLVVSSDTYVSQGANASLNFGTLTSISVGGGNKALIQMDLNALPPGLTAANIQKATLTIYVNKALIAGGLDFSLVTSAWTETGVTFNVQPSVASAFAINVPVATSNTYVTVDVTAQVQEWVQGVFPNNGIEISASAANPTTQVILDSKETTSSSHPAFIDVTVVSIGPSGPTGAAGPSGPSGPQGTAGAAGPSGPLGPQGATGPSGPQGTAGAAGPSGPLGPQGASGPSGPLGTAGAAGPSGPLGPQGATGPSGPQGTAGAAGPSGPLGPQGATGPSGPLGTAGAAGPSGPLGPQGATGPSGPLGTAGAAGPSGPLGPRGATGPSGPQGTAGAAGPSGPLGPQGFTGPAGATGPQGSATGTLFSASLPINATTSTQFAALNGAGINQPNFDYVATPMAAPCTFNTLAAVATISANAVSDLITVTLVKNGIPTSMSVSMSVSGLNVPVTAVTTANQFSIAPGDLVAYQYSQSTGTPTIKLNVSSACK